MKHYLFTLIALALSLSMYGQNAAEQTENVLLFEEYSPAVVEFHNGKLNHQLKANIFLKNGALVYQQGKEVMEARMDVIRHVIIKGKVFVAVNNKLAEIVDSCGPNKLLRMKLIDMEAFERQFLNESSVTNFEIGDNISVTRLEKELHTYPVAIYYYFRFGDKYVACHEREVGRIVPKQNRDRYRKRLARGEFSWSNEDDLMEMLRLISR